MKEHKNPKVLSEGILWMVSAVEDFGVSHLKLKVSPILPHITYLNCCTHAFCIILPVFI